MSVHYKFENTIDYDAVKFDGIHISAPDLKSIIVQQKKLGHSELKLENEETGQVYTDDQQIPKNTNIIISRLPFENSNKKIRLATNQPYPSKFSGNAAGPVTNKSNHHHNNTSNNHQQVKLRIPNAKNLQNGSIPETVRYPHYNRLLTKKICDDLVKSRVKTIPTFPIYSFSVNLLSKQTKNEKVTYVPIEIGIYGYSFKDGRITEPYHVIIDAGNPPVGTLGLATEHSKATHKIRFSPMSEGYPKQARNDYAQIYREMINYTSKGERTIIIQDYSELDQVKGSLEWIQEKAQVTDPSAPSVSTWTIVPIIEFLVSMHDLIYYKMLNNSIIRVGIHYDLKLRLQKCVLDYNSALMCRYHATLPDQTKWCARACALRTVMNLEDFIQEISDLYEEATNTAPDLKQQKPPLAISHERIPQNSIENSQQVFAIMGPQPTNSVSYPKNHPIMGPAIIPTGISPIAQESSQEARFVD